MKKLKRITTAILAVYILSAAAFAEETHTAQFKVNVDNKQNVTVTESSFISEKDNSDLNVNVVKYSGGNKSLIYSGALGGYDNGAWSNMDFSEIQCAVIFNWDNANEYYCITPVTDALSYTDGVNAKTNTAENKTNLTSYSVGTVTSNMSLVYNGKYYENVLMPGQELTVQVSVTNNENTLKNVVPYIAQYDLSGKLINIKQGTDIPAAAIATTTGTVTENLTADTAYTAKVFLWEKASLKPLHTPIAMQITAQDYYADDFANAETIKLDKSLCGIINTSDDVDIIKIHPTETGLYAMRLNADASTAAALYNSEQNLLKATSANDKYLFYSLTKDNDYYIRFNGNENNNYTISPANKVTATNVLKNAGQTKSIGADEVCNVYSFTPSEDGTYIITAVGTAGVKASLYGSGYEYISSAQTADSDVSFRITNTMQAGQTYYILVSSKTDNTAENYTLYVEQPFDIISVN